MWQAVRHCAQESSEGEKRGWNRYAERTAAYAFGVAGDVELARNAMFKPVEPVKIPPPKESEMPRMRMR
jgi:hypothetical protein